MIFFALFVGVALFVGSRDGGLVGNSESASHRQLLFQILTSLKSTCVLQ